MSDDGRHLQLSASELRDMLHEIDENGEGLTEWEVNFVARMVDTDPDDFTERQAFRIVQIYDSRAS